MKLKFPAMRGLIGKREFYSCMMSLSIVPKMFTFRDWAEFTPEDREQRILNDKRVPHIARYIVDNEDGYLFSSITASYKCAVAFHPTEEDPSLGLLEMDFGDAEFVINDGQHRCAAIAAALTQNPSLAEETISVLLFPYENRDRMQQMFSDLNRFVQKTSKSLDILYDKRDSLSSITLQVIKRVEVFDGMVDRDAISIGIRSPKLFTLSTVYDANKELLRFKEDESQDEESDSAKVAKAVEFWRAVSDQMPDWSEVKNGNRRAMDLRQESIATHSVVLRAIGAAGAELLEASPEDWRDRLRALREVDWRKSNEDWQSVCIVANSVSSNRQARQATKAYLKRKLGLSLTHAEERSLAPPEALISAAP